MYTVIGVVGFYTVCSVSIKPMLFNETDISPMKQKAFNKSPKKKATEPICEEISAVEARKDFSALATRVSAQHERVVVTRNRDKFACVPMEDLLLLQALENHIDIRDALEALERIEKEGTDSFEDVMKYLGVK